MDSSIGFVEHKKRIVEEKHRFVWYDLAMKFSIMEEQQYNHNSDNISHNEIGVANETYTSSLSSGVSQLSRQKCSNVTISQFNKSLIDDSNSKEIENEQNTITSSSGKAVNRKTFHGRKKKTKANPDPFLKTK